LRLFLALRLLRLFFLALRDLLRDLLRFLPFKGRRQRCAGFGHAHPRAAYASSE
jgi:hypothetical protein